MAGVAAGAGCTHESPTEAICPGPGIQALFLWVGSGTNQVNAATDYATEITGTGATKNVFHGGTGANVITGGPGDDVLTGGAVGDTIDGKGGNDELDGGAGPDSLGGGPGADRVDYSARTADVRVSLGAGLLSDGQAGEGDSVGSDVENVKTGAGDDLILAAGDSAANVFHGGAGTDHLVGGAGPDELLGEEGADLLEGGSGVDSLSGQGGDDRLGAGDDGDFVDGGAGDDLLDGGAGDDIVNGREADDVLWGGAGSDRLAGGAGDDTVTYAGVNVPVTVDLDEVDYDDGAEGEGDSVHGAERIIGGSAGDTLAGNAAANVIRGGDGNDSIDGGGAADQLFGESGDDVLRSVDGGNDANDCGAGTDTALADAIDTLAGCELPAPVGQQPPIGQPPAEQPGPGPAVGIALAAKRATTSGHARVRVSCPATATGRCAGTLRLVRNVGRRGKTVRCGARSFSALAGRSTTVRVKLASGCRRALRRTGRIELRAAVTAADAVSVARITTQRVSIKRAGSR
jgi:hypothetical protein